jgi:hypothetical protein
MNAVQFKLSQIKVFVHLTFNFNGPKSISVLYCLHFRFSSAHCYLRQLGFHCTAPHTVVITCTAWFNIEKLCILATVCINVFHRIPTINSDYFPRTALSGWFLLWRQSLLWGMNWILMFFIRISALRNCKIFLTTNTFQEPHTAHNIQSTRLTLLYSVACPHFRIFADIKFLISICNMYSGLLALLFTCLAFCGLVSLDFPCTAHAFFSEHLSKHCEGLRCTKFDAVPLWDPSWNRIRPHTRPQIRGCNKSARPPSCIQFCALSPKIC